VSGFNALHWASPLITRTLPAKKNRERVADGTKILLDIAKESSDWFPPLKSALGGVCALVKHYEVIAEWVAIVHDLRGRSQQFEDVKEKIEELIPRLNRFKQNANGVSVDGDQAEEKRRSELAGYAHRLLAPPAPVDGFSAR